MKVIYSEEDQAIINMAQYCLKEYTRAFSIRLLSGVVSSSIEGQIKVREALDRDPTFIALQRKLAEVYSCCIPVRIEYEHCKNNHTVRIDS